MIYFIQGKPGTPVKIGYTRDRGSLEKRIAALQCGYPYELRVVFLAEGFQSEEREIHAALSADRLLGEWFEWSGRVENMRNCLLNAQSPSAAVAEFRAIEATAAVTAAEGGRLVSGTNIARLFDIKHDVARSLTRTNKLPAPVTINRGGQTYRFHYVRDVQLALDSMGVRHRIQPYLMVNCTRTLGALFERFGQPAAAETAGG